MTYWVYRRGDALYPGDERATRYVRRLYEGEAVQVEIERSRSYQWHKMYISCCISIGENCDPTRAWQSIDAELRVRSGHFDVVPIHGVDGVEIRMPKRIAFKHLSAEQWEELWPRLDQAMIEGFKFDFHRWKEGQAQIA